MTRPTSTQEPRLTVERAVPALAGVMITISVVLALTVSPWWSVLTLFMAANLLLYSAVGWCPASLLMSKTGLAHSSCPNRAPAAAPR